MGERTQAAESEKKGFFRALIHAFRELPVLARVAVFVVLLSQVPLVRFVANRLFEPFEPDGCPYHHMHMTDRVLDGKPLYAPAAPDHSAVTYTPLYWWINAPLFKMFGSRLPVARMVSVFSSLIIAWLIGWFIWLNTRKNLLLTLAGPAFVMSSALLADFSIWIVDVNVNSLHVALAVGGFFLLRDPLTLKKTVFSALLMVLCVVAKQTGTAYVVAAAVLVFLKAPRLGLVFAIISAAGLGLFVAGMNAATAGEFYRITVTGNRVPAWLIHRLYDEVLLTTFVQLFGVVFLMAIIQGLSEDFRRFPAPFLKAEYFMAAAGVAVGCIAHPKIGSGPLHELVAICGLSVVGCMGIQTLMENLPRPVGQRIGVAIPLLQLGVLVLSGMLFLPFVTIDDFDRMKYQQITEVFRAGRTVMLDFPYLQKSFGQPQSGYPGDDFCKMVDGRLDYSNMPDELIAPYRNQEFEFVILPGSWDRNDPVFQAAVSNYYVVGRIPGHPRGPRGGNLRYEHFVLRANRLRPMAPPEEVAPQRQGYPMRWQP